MDLQTEYIKVIYLSDEKDARYVYHLPKPTDWKYIDSIAPPLPTATVDLSDGTQYGGHNLNATIAKLVHIHDGQEDVLKDRDLKIYEGAGIFGSTAYTDATVTFSMPLLSKVEVLIESWDYRSAYTLILDATEDSIIFEVPDYPAHYTITASFEGSNGVYETSFIFHIGDADSM